VLLYFVLFAIYCIILETVLKRTMYKKWLQKEQTRDKLVGFAIADVVESIKMSLESNVLPLSKFDFVGPDVRNNTIITYYIEIHKFTGQKSMI